MILLRKHCWEPFCSGWNNVSDICSHGRHKSRLMSIPFPPLQVWRMFFVSPGWVTDGHRALGCPCHVSHREDASGICIQAILLPGSLQKAKEAFFPSRLMAPLTIRIYSISKSGQRWLDRKASFPDSDSTHWLFEEGVQPKGSVAASEFHPVLYTSQQQ